MDRGKFKQEGICGFCAVAIDDYLRGLSKVEEADPSAALAEDGADKGRAGFPPACSVSVNLGVEGGLSAGTWVGVKLSFNVQAHVLKTFLDAKDRGRQRRGMHHAGFCFHGHELAEKDELLAEEGLLDASDKTDLFRWLEQIRCLVEQGRRHDVGGGHCRLRLAALTSKAFRSTC